MPLSFIDRPRRPHTALRVTWALTGILLGIAFVFPIRFGLMRLGMVGGALLFWAGALYLFWRRPWARTLFLAPAILLGLIGLLPDRDVDVPRLRQTYLAALKGYEGTPYVWGGETHLGIDCSGLVRSGMVEACLREGARTQNPALLRDAASIWWFDCSAKALGEEYQGRTHHLLDAKSLNELDYAQIEPGDVAVTDSGLHTLAYMGDRTWIQADPGAYRVVTSQAPSDQGWFVQGVRVVRWQQFSGPSSAPVQATTHSQVASAADTTMRPAVPTP